MASVVTSIGAASSSLGVTSLTSGAVSPSGTNRAVYAAISGDSGAGSGARYGGSGGTSLAQVSATRALGFNNARFNGWADAGSPSASTTGYASFGAPQDSAAASFVFLAGVDQADPFGTEVATGSFGIAATVAASVDLSGLTPGQLVVAGLGVLNYETMVVTSTNAATSVVEFRQGGGGNRVSTAILHGVADASGDLTLAVNLAGASSSFIAWGISALPVNDAAGGVTSHESSGALEAQPAAIAGAAVVVVPAVEHDAGGALVAQAATVAGTAARTRLHPTTGALVAQAATVSGTATRSAGPVSHPTTGALVAQAATVAGLAARTRLHPTTGALTAGSATLAGTAARTRLHPSTGALAAQAAVVAGDATNTPADGPHAATGALIAQAATVSGVAGVVHLASDVTGGWGTYYPRRKRKPVEPVEPERIEEVQEQAAEQQKATQARQALRRAERRDKQVTAELRRLYAEQDALTRAISVAQEDIARQIEDDEEVALLLSLAS